VTSSVDLAPPSSLTSTENTKEEFTSTKRTSGAMNTISDLSFVSKSTAIPLACFHKYLSLADSLSKALT
jgi:hypothetical protein